MKINIEEHRIEGKWNFDGTKMVADDACKRIEWLINNSLKKIAVDKTGWDILYKDLTDNRYWELIYPNSEVHGGGAPSLVLLSDKEASIKFSL